MDLPAEVPQERAVGPRQCLLMQTIDLLVVYQEGSALLLRHAALAVALCCSSGLLEHYALLSCFRAVCGIIPAWLLRASEDGINLA